MLKDSMHLSLQTMLTVIFCYNLGNICAYRQPDKYGIMCSNFSSHPYINASNCKPTKTIWDDLAIITVELFKFQNNLQSFQNQKSNLILIIFESVTDSAASDFVSGISNLNIRLIYFEVLKANVDFQNELGEICKILRYNRDTITGVVMFLDNTSVIFELFNNVSFTEALNLTTVRHVTEWLVVSRDFPILLINESNFLIDFISIIFKQDNNIIAIAQKSRTENFSVKVKILTNHFQMSSCKSESLERVHLLFRGISSKNILRKSGYFYLKSQKSILSGLRIPVTMVSMKTQDLFVALSTNKLSNYERFSVALLNVLAEHLNFTYYIMVPSDGGYFGVVDNGNATGMTGQFDRREAALTTMPMNPINNRKNSMDFVPVQIMSDVVYLVYRLPQPNDLVDMTYIRILRPDFVHVHVAAVLFILVFRAAVHIFWYSKQTIGNVPGNRCYWISRKLQSLLVHLCGDTIEIRSPHSERILMASWQIFWFIMWSAYSAYLVTSFVASPKEITIRSFKDLDENKNFHLGIMNSLSSTITSLKQSGSHHIQAVWSRLEASRKFNPLTFSTNMSYHAQRILAGGYVYIDGTGLLLGEYDYFLPNHTDIRYYPTSDLNFMYPSLVGIPTEVFYKETLRKLLSNLDENGTLERLKYKHFNLGTSAQLDKGQISEENNPVTLKRIGVLLFVTIGGVLLSVLTLICENVFYRWMMKTKTIF